MAHPPRLVGLGTALPQHRVRQDDVQRFASTLFARILEGDGRRLLAVFENAGIETRHFSMPLEWFATARDFGTTNALYVEHALALVERAARTALERAGLGGADVDHIVFVSSTGLATPSLDARLAGRLGCRGDVRRTPLWGLGCAGGAAGLARARDFALADPTARVLLVCVELCSLTFQRDDLSRQNLVAASLFADGAAAALVQGAAAPAPGAASDGRSTLDLLAARSTLWPDSLDIMGWEVDGTGLHVVFSRDIPTVVREWVRPAVDDFLAAHGLDTASLPHVVAHPGGPKVIAAYAAALGRDPADFVHARETLRDCGNMSSPTCLFVLDRLLDSGGLGAGQHALLAALGPGFASEMVLMRRPTA